MTTVAAHARAAETASGDRRTYGRLRIANLGLIVLHAGQAALILALGASLELPVTAQ